MRDNATVTLATAAAVLTYPKDPSRYPHTYRPKSNPTIPHSLLTKNQT